MNKYVLNFEQFVKESQNIETNEFFSFKKKELSPIQEELDMFLDIIGSLDVKFDSLYDISEAEANKAKTIAELMHIVNKVLKELKEVNFLSPDDINVKDSLEIFKEELASKSIAMNV
jgi:hypothetical protein